MDLFLTPTQALGMWKYWDFGCSVKAPRTYLNLQIQIQN